jgi:DNA-binding transcriptional ArsR family regulator
VPDSSSTDLVAWLRAAGESTRLRLLALCADRDLSVSDLATGVAQSEPRVSRHLKILSEAGLIARVRQGQWVHYRVTQTEPAAGFVQSLLAQVSRNDEQLIRDRGRLAAATATALTQQSSAGESKLGRALRSFLEGTVSGKAPRSALVVGVDHLEVLEATARTAGRCAAIAHSRRAAQAARAYADREEFTCQVLLAANGETLSERDIAKAGEAFDAIVLDRFRTNSGALAAMLSTAKRALADGGRLWLFERYESLESPRERVVEHPIARVRRLLSESGLACERLSPIEADGEHVLAAVAALRAQSPSQTSVA